jgi:cytochrome c2
MRLSPAALGVALSIPALVLAAPQGRGDPARGETAYQKCYACHALEPGRSLEGPSLDRILGRRIAGEQGFAYSASLRALATRHGRWDEALLDRFIADPEGLAPRTKMNFQGLRDPRERSDLIAYLRGGARR